MLFSLLLPWLAHAYCDPVAAVSEKVGICEENFHFVRAADACVAKLNAEVSEATAQLNAGFIRNDGKNQSVNFQSSGSDYNLSSATLARLISSAKAALADVQSYYPAVVEQDDQEALPAGEEATIPCYFRTRSAIVHVASVLDAKIRNLQTTKAAADSHQGTSGAREENNSALGPGPAAATTAAGSARRVPAGKSAPGASDITGTNEARKKAREGERTLQKQQ